MKKLLDKRNIIIIVLLLLIGGGFYYYKDKMATAKERLSSEVKLKNALLAEVQTYQNKQGEWVSEKLTLQTSIDNLEEDKDILSKSQLNLLKRLTLANKENKVINAALIEMGAEINNLTNVDAIIVDSTTIAFREDTDSLRYNIEIKNVRPHPVYPTLCYIFLLVHPRNLLPRGLTPPRIYPF